MREAWICSCGKENNGRFCTECGKELKEKWRCACGEESDGNYCSECGKPRSAKWSELYFSHRGMSINGNYSFSLKEDFSGNVYLSGECFDGAKSISANLSDKITVDGDIVEALRDMKLDALPVVVKRELVPAGQQPLDGSAEHLGLTYSDGATYKKRIPAELRSRIYTMLSAELIKKGREASSDEEFRFFPSSGIFPREPE